MKVFYPDLDSTCLLTLPIVIFIERFTISMGIAAEFQGVYAIVCCGPVIVSADPASEYS